MPDKALVFSTAGIVLQYSLLIFIYYFMFKVIRIIAKDLRMPRQSAVTAPSNQNSGWYSSFSKLVVVDAGALTLAQMNYVLGETMAIGRNIQNELVIDDAFVSYEHATINKNKQGYWLTDLKSTNKTYLNGQAITDSVLLENGDIIKIGAVTFRFEG